MEDKLLNVKRRYPKKDEQEVKQEYYVAVFRMKNEDSRELFCRIFNPKIVAHSRHSDEKTNF